MKKTRKTIFDLERRNDLFSDYNRTIYDLKMTDVRSKSLDKITLMQLMNDCIKTWPYRQAATSISAYADAHGFMFSDAQTDVDVLYSYELLLNLLYWAPSYETSRSDFLDWNNSSTVNEECTRCIENICFNLEMINMRVRIIEGEDGPQYVISKRDAQVDAVIEAVPQLSDTLLSYLDVRNQNDENAKKAVLKAIADHLEQKRKDGCYKGTSYNGLCEDLFAVFNNASIRHKNNKQWKLPKPARIKLYDQTFKAAIHLLQMEDMDAFQARVKELKKPPSNGNEAH